MNTAGPVPQFVFDSSIKMLVVNERGGIGRTSSFTTGRLAYAREEKKIPHATEGERVTSHVRTKVLCPLAASLSGLG